VNTRILMAAAFATLVACDPYPSARGGDPQVLTAVAASFFDPDAGAAPAKPPEAALFAPPAIPPEPQQPPVLTIGTVPFDDPANYPADDAATADVCETMAAWEAETTRSTRPADGDSQFLLFVRLNKLMDGTSIQTAVDDCTPAGPPPTGWLTVTETGTPPACATGTPKWFTCYQPSSPSANEGASVVIYRSCAATSAGWEDAVPLQNGATFTFSGSIKDKAGTVLPIAVTMKTAATPPEPTTCPE
jgi:hypothetical protein